MGDIVGIVVAAIFAYFAPELFGELLLTDAQYAAISLGFAGFVSGFVGSYISTGSLSSALMSGLISGITAGLTAGAGAQVLAGDWTPAEGVIARVAVGCASAVASGGNCGKGALSAGFAVAVQPLIIKAPSFGDWGNVPEAVQAGLIGGEAAKLSGGKFEDGFSTSAVQYLASPSQHSSRDDIGVVAQVVRDVQAMR